MAHNPPVDVQQYGQSIWLDYIHRKELESGEFQRRLAEDGVMGVTSNPAIFQQAIGESDIYDPVISRLMDLDAEQIYEHLALEDIQNAADQLRSIYDRTDGQDGYVSLEVSPLLAHNTEGTLAEARRLFQAVNRPNVMIKIPGTPEGLPAIESAIAEGININITLLFAVGNYEQVAEAYIKGLERRHAAGQAVGRVASVASFFLSRIDSMIDRILENNIRSAQVTGDTGRIAANRRLLGQAAIASAKLAYRAFQRLFGSARFKALQAAGARVQRPLWASTGTKNPAYPDTRYVDLLIGPDTVNTLPPKTLAAFKDHGTAAETITRNLDDMLPPEEVIDKLAEVGIDIDQIAARLQSDGVELFVDAFDKLISQVYAKRTILKTGVFARLNIATGIFAEAFDRTVDELDRKLTARRLWSKDGSLWKEHGPTIAKIVNRLGWLDVQKTIDLGRLKALQAAVRDSAVQQVVLLGMGGSSLAPEVMYKTFGRQPGFPELLVLDSTDPARISAVEKAVSLPHTLFIVASKSGTTVETDSFFRYFWQQTGGAGSQFIAITDPGTVLEQQARQQGFREVFVNPADIGGRYSALSYFGMVPAALIGVDLDRAWASATSLMDACGETIPTGQNPGLLMGAFMGAMAQARRDKLCIFCTDALVSFGDWAEQLVAESLGKEGRGVIPVVGATVGKPHDYASDRVFVYLRVDDDRAVDETDADVRALREAGHPRLTTRLPDAYALFGEFFRWEFATAVAGVVLQVNPFDEPNVTEAKEATGKLLAHYQEHGSLPETAPLMHGEHVRLYSSERTMKPLRELCRSHGYSDSSRTELLAAQIAGTQAGDYFAVLAYLTPDPATDEQLRTIQRRLRHVTRRAVTVGYGPRYLHSTGQLHKGGANNGVFILLTRTLKDDLPIPGMPYSFGTLFSAQSEGDLNTLYQHQRRAIRLHIEDNVTDGVNKLIAAIEFVENRWR
ncbi:MAG: bifunctional transaldolase/phosoglucose isomerase [Anaerolineae bacterium]|nr:bifunctional transaldolase/phosoglucose isomerase [Anaerolineae bacterium]